MATFIPQTIRRQIRDYLEEDDDPPDAKLNDAEADSLALAGKGPVTGLFGDSGEYVPLTFGQMLGNGQNTTNTDYEDPLFAGIRPLMLNPTGFQVSGIDSYHLIAWGDYGSDGGNSTAYVRIRGYPGTEVSTGAQYDIYQTPAVEFDPSSKDQPLTADPEIKTADGATAAILRAYHVGVFGKLE
jgi:hypothetical protein